MSGFKPVDPKQSFPQLELRVLERWRERDVFARQLAQRRDAGAPIWSFYEGPPTANGKPGSHHVLARAFKDVYPRYQAMRGNYVPRKAGWDCHGLPVELEVEKELGISSKAEIEEYGIAEFNARCRESVFRYVEEWNRLTERIGFWIDLDDPYVTLTNEYIESVWWSLRQIWDSGRLYKAHKVVPYCPRDGTALSSHEVAQGYEDVVDPSVYVRLPVTDVPPADEIPENSIEAGDNLLVWTTTPWTLISHAAVAVGPEIEYVRARLGEETVIVARPLVERVLGEDAEVLAHLPGAALEGVRYEAPFDFIKGEEFGPLGHSVLLADFVSTEEGTGLVHTALAFGEDDFKLGERYGMTLQNPVRPDGTYDERVPDFQGKMVFEHNDEIVEALRESGRLFRAERYEHAYPHCWRCGTPLIYYATSSWYVATSELRELMLEVNEGIDWHPEHIKHGRFGKWLEGNVDWALSRERYWGTPLPIWECGDCEERWCAGSIAELRERGGQVPDDLHRPYIDEVTVRCDSCGGEMRRVVETIDAWFDSGSMPFAQFHHPFERQRRVRGPVSRRLRLRGHRPDARLVLLAARCRHPGLRAGQLRALRLPRADRRPRGSEDVHQSRQRGRSLGGDRYPWRRRVSLVLPQLPAALDGLSLRRRYGRRVAARVHPHPLEHVLVLGPLRERRGARAGGLGGRSARRRGTARSVGAEPPAGHRRHRDRAHGRL